MFGLAKPRETKERALKTSLWDDMTLTLIASFPCSKTEGEVGTLVHDERVFMKRYRARNKAVEK